MGDTDPGRAERGAGRLTDELRRIGRGAGLDAVGVAPAEVFDSTRRHLHERRRAGLHGGMQFTYRDPDRSTDPGRCLPGARSIFVGARSYRMERSAPPPGRPAGQVASYSWRDHYEPLRHALGDVASRLRADGFGARVVVDDNALVDREAARRAGLGWYGKNTLLLLPGRGSWFVLGSVVTDADLVPSGQAPDDGCGGCTRCLAACPTGALVSAGVLDARRCLAWLLEAPGWFPREHRAALGGRIYGCDDCQDACPINRLADRRRPPQGPGPVDEPWVDLLALLAAPDSELIARFGRWYIPRREARYLRRNALVALGNVGDGRDPAVVVAIREALASPDPIVRGHAVWAASRLRRSDLVAEMAPEETDPDVRSELRAASA